MTLKLPAALSVAAIALFALSSTPSLEAQLRKDSSGNSTRKAYTPKRTGATHTRASSDRNTTRRPTSSSSRPAGSSSSSSSSATDANAETVAQDAEAESQSAAPKGFAGKLRNFVKKQYVAILVVLGVSLLGVLSWIFLGSRSRKQAEPFLEPLDDELEAAAPKSSGGDRRGGRGSRYSSTRISAADVNSRLSGHSVREEEVETDVEYALVVEQDALSQQEVDENTGRTYADETRIRQCLSSKDFGGAYVAYLGMIELDGRNEFHTDIEHQLSEHFLQSAEYDKAARVLEHHVATHADEDVHPETYFNLGYIHFQKQTVAKSRRFFKLFVEKDKRPEYVARAQRILAALDASPGSGAAQN